MNRCSICPSTHKCILGSGPRPARYAIFGERPGQNEEKQNRVFVGDAGKEQDQLYLPLAGISRDECYVSNSVKCGADRNKKPTDKEIEVCSDHFVADELRQVQPFLVILQGASACKLVDGLDLEVQHGIPFWGKIFDWPGWIVAMYHPAAGMHNTSLMIPLIDDWKWLGKWLKGRPVEHYSPFEWTDFRVAQNDRDVQDYFKEYEIRPDYLGGDSESQEGEQYSVQVSSQVGTGLMVMMDNDLALKGLRRGLTKALQSDVKLVLHNAPADLKPFESILEESIDGFYIDTMQCSYHFQNLPQGLKALAYRLLHKKRRSWDEVVGPPSKDVLRRWLLESMEKCPPEVIPQVSEKTGRPIKPKVVRDPMEKKLAHILLHMSKSPDYNPWEVKKGVSRITPEMDERFGRAPRKGIAHVPLTDAKDYAIQDASDCLELALLFDRMRAEIVKKEWNVQEEDQDEIGVPLCHDLTEIPITTG